MTAKLLKKTAITFASLAILQTSPLPIVTDASADNLLKIIFGGQARKKREAEKRKQEEAARLAAQAKPIRIAGPRYRTYRADKLVAVKLDELIDPFTTSAVGEAESTVVETEKNPFALGLENSKGLKLRALPEVASIVLDQYKTNPKFRWVTEQGPTQKALTVLKTLNEAELVGLPSDNYTVELPKLEGVFDEGENKWSEMMRFEMQFSIAALTYILDATRGLVDPNRLSDYHDFKRKEPDLAKELVNISYGSDLEALMESYGPTGEHFLALKTELSELLDADEKERVTIAEGTFLKPGRESPEMSNIVASIRIKGSEALKTEYAYELNTYRGDDLYTPELVTVVKAFQKENNLAADGIIGKKTIRAMVEDSNAVKIEKLQLAMERARWLPPKFAAKHVFINQPAYKVTYFEDSEPYISMRVVVGKKSNQTYFFSDEIEKVEFNPYWGVPQSIITNEMLPKLRSDPSYLDRLGYEVTYNGKRTSSRSLNWSAMGSMRAVGVRQPPSRKNALGQLKILFPNEHAIYMHDTPAKSLFNRDTRAFSHGCVRLHQPKEMAAAVLGTNLDEINAYIAPGRNKTVFVEKTIPVHVAYFTAWLNAETDQIEYFDDVYGRDKALRKAITTTMQSRLPTS